MGRKLVSAVECWANHAFTSDYNPFYYLGQLSIFFLILLVVSGIYLLPFYKINVVLAYDSVNAITEEQWFPGGVMRSIHRYAADGLVITMVLHGLRLLLLGKLYFNRWLIWVSGVALFGFMLVEGVTGYWMVWDERALLVATTTTEFLDILPIFPEPLSRAFISSASLTNLLFFAVIFIHIAGPLFLIAMLLLHFSRFTRTKLLPSRELMAAVLLLSLALSFLKPAVSAPPADLGKIPTDVPVDWFYMFLLPLMQGGMDYLSWLVLLALAIAILALPWLGRPSRRTAEVVDERCVGCELCYRDCPYTAITMREKEDSSIAGVSESLCSGCGLCVGSCNFNAVRLNGMELEDMKSEVEKLLPEAQTPVLALVCENALELARDLESNGSLKGYEDVKALSMPCIGMVNPMLITYALDRGFSGVFIVGCKLGDCDYRLGNRWLKERLEGIRGPVLKDSRTERIKALWLSPAEMDELHKSIDSFRNELRAKEPPARKEKKPALVLAAVILLLPSLLAWHFSTSPAYSPLEPGKAVLLFTMSHTAERAVPCEEPTPEELSTGNYTPCERERVPVRVELKVDSREVLGKAYEPRGLRDDGPSYAYEKLKLDAGEHRVSLRVSDSREERYGYSFHKTIEFNESQLVVIDLTEKTISTSAPG